MHWYKLLVWCKERELQAEYIFAEHKNEKFVSYKQHNYSHCCHSDVTIHFVAAKYSTWIF